MRAFGQLAEGLLIVHYGGIRGLSNSCSHILSSSLHNVYYTKLSWHIEQLHDCSHTTVTPLTHDLTEQHGTPARWTAIYQASWRVPAAVKGLEGRGSCHSYGGAANYRALRNSASFRVRLSDLFFLEFLYRAVRQLPTDSKNGWPILFFAVFLIRLPTTVTITRTISCLVSLFTTPYRTK